MSNSDDKILEWIEDSEQVIIEDEIELQEEPKVYEKKIVAWFDVLGIREKIKADDNAENIIHIMKQLRAVVNEQCELLQKKDRLHYLQIADGFMIVANVDCHKEVCEILSKLQWLILWKLNMLARGAVTLGDVSVFEINEEKLIIGPAYVKAYQLESENAIFSRIILDKLFMKEFEDIKENTWIKEDMDGFFYLDFLEHTMQSENKNAANIDEIFMKEGVVDTIKEGYNHQSASVVQKYSWFISLLKMNKISILKYTERED